MEIKTKVAEESLSKVLQNARFDLICVELSDIVLNRRISRNHVDQVIQRKPNIRVRHNLCLFCSKFVLLPLTLLHAENVSLQQAQINVVNNISLLLS